MTWLQRIGMIVAREGAAARIVIVGTEGPTPRAAGAAMLVWADGHEGKIARPDVERRAVAEARRLMARLPKDAAARPAWLRERLRFDSGEVLGEATGGAIDVLAEAFGPHEAAALARLEAEASGEGVPVLVRPMVGSVAPNLLDARAAAGRQDLLHALAELGGQPQRTLLRLSQASGTDLVLEKATPQKEALCVYGTGVVARALVKLLADLPFDVTWLDTTPGHFPAAVPDGVSAIASPDLAEAARRSRPGTFHAIMTAAHDLDLAVCRGVLEAGTFAYLGVIGSQLKRQRMTARLREEGFADAMLSRIACPIGIPQIRGKAPAVIAVGIAAQALSALGGRDGRGDCGYAWPPAGSKT